MIYFYALISSGTIRRRIPKSFAHALKHLEEINVLENKGEYCILKPHFIIGSVDISRSGKIYIKSLNIKDEKMLFGARHRHIKHSALLL